MKAHNHPEIEMKFFNARVSAKSQIAETIQHISLILKNTVIDEKATELLKTTQALLTSLQEKGESVNNQSMECVRKLLGQFTRLTQLYEENQINFEKIIKTKLIKSTLEKLNEGFQTINNADEPLPIMNM